MRLFCFAGFVRDVDNIAVLIDGAPKILALALNIEEHLIHKPRIATSLLFLAEILSVVQTKFLTPLVDGFIGNNLAYPVACQFSEMMLICENGSPRLSDNTSRVSEGFPR
jgi:hypothetical protein